MADVNPTTSAPATDATAAAPVTTSPQAQPSAPSFAQAASEVMQAADTSAAGSEQVTQTATTDMVVDYLRKQGVEIPEGAKGEELLDRIVGEYQTMNRQLQQVQPVITDYQRNSDKFNQWLAQQQAPEPTQPEPTANKWQAPEWNPEWQKLVRLDEETGRYIPANQFISPTIADKANAYADWRRKTIDDFTTSPLEVIRKAGLDDYLQEQLKNAREQWEVEQYSRSRQQEMQALIRTDAPLLFLHDGNGNVQRDQLGNPVQTPVGQMVFSFMRQAQQNGITDPVLAYQHGLSQTELLQHRWMLAQQQAGQPPAAQPPEPAAKKNDAPERERDEYGRFLPQPTEQKKSEFLDNARANGRGPTGQRNQSIATAAIAEIEQNEGLSFEQLGFEIAGQHGKGPLAGKYNA